MAWSSQISFRNSTVEFKGATSGVVVSSGRNRVKLFFWGGGGPYPGADTGFPEGGGGEDIHKPPPPWTLSA